MNPAKPLALVRLEGNRGKQKIPKASEEVKLPPGEPGMPGWLLPEARKEWARVAPRLTAVRVLTDVDAAMLAAYCQLWARWRKAETGKRKNASPAVGLSLLREMRMVCRELGMTPSARARMVVPGEVAKDEMDDLMDGVAK